MVAYSFKKRFVTPIRAGLGLPLNVEDFAARMDEFGNVSHPRPKRQTIRAIGKRRHARPGEEVQLYCGMRTRQCFKIGDARCSNIADIRLDLRGSGKIEISGDDIVAREIRTRDGLNEFAQKDGFADWSDMLKFWESEHGLDEFTGVLIEWKPL